MCGLIGFSSNNKNTKVDLIKFKQLMLWNTISRGTDAAGIYNNIDGVIKDNDRCDIFLSKNIDTINADCIMIGHVRSKTVGGNFKSNAHPFKEDNLTLAHNGTLEHVFSWGNKYGISSTGVDVDSHMLTKILAKEKSFSPLKELPGAAALIMHDSNSERMLFIFRNKLRPLFYGNIKEEGMYISSMKESLESIGINDIKEFDEEMLYTILDGKIRSKLEYKIDKPYTPIVVSSAVSTVTNKESQVFYDKYIWENIENTWCVASTMRHNILDKDNPLMPGCYYLVVKTTNERVKADNRLGNYDMGRNYVIVQDTADFKIKIDPWLLDVSVCTIKPNCFAVALSDLKYSKEGEHKGAVAIPKGAVVKVIEVGDTDIMNNIKVLYNDKSLYAKKENIRKTTFSENINSRFDEKNDSSYKDGIILNNISYGLIKTTLMPNLFEAIDTETPFDSAIDIQNPTVPLLGNSTQEEEYTRLEVEEVEVTILQSDALNYIDDFIIKLESIQLFEFCLNENERDVFNSELDALVEEIENMREWIASPEEDLIEEDEETNNRIINQFKTHD